MKSPRDLHGSQKVSTKSRRDVDNMRQEAVDYIIPFHGGSFYGRQVSHGLISGAMATRVLMNMSMVMGTIPPGVVPEMSWWNEPLELYI